MASVNRTVRIDAATSANVWIVSKHPYFSTPETVKADIQAAEEAWKNGYQGHTLEEVLAGMDRIIEEVGVEGT